MLNTLTTFEKLIQEHEVIQSNTKQIAGSADNLLTLSNLQGNPANFTSYQVNYLGDKRMNLKRSITSLREGLTSHFHLEEEVLRSLLGIPLMRVLKQEHQEALERLEEIDWILLNVGPMGILANSSFIKQKVDVLCQVLNVGCNRENSILELLIKLPENYI